MGWEKKNSNCKVWMAWLFEKVIKSIFLNAKPSQFFKLQTSRKLGLARPKKQVLLVPGGVAYVEY